MADPISAIALGTAATSTSAATAGLFTTVAAGAAVPTFSLGATLSTLGTGFSIFSALSGGGAEKSLYESEARLSEFNARQEEIRGLEEANLIKRDVARALASANARGAASGIDISSGSPVTASQEALRDANNALSTAGTNAKLRAEAERMRARLARQRGRNAVRSGRLSAASILGDFSIDAAEKAGFSF
jgi:hypothetical protein